MRFAPTVRQSRAVTAALATVLALGLPAAAFAHAAHRTISTQVFVTFTDKTLSVSPGTLSETGPAVIFLHNRGHYSHVLTIKGPGLNGVQTQLVAPGVSMALHLKLLVGAYAMSAGLKGAAVRYLVVSSNIVGPPVSAPVAPQSPTTAVATGSMDCTL
jgi:hypothetical protein